MFIYLPCSSNVFEQHIRTSFTTNLIDVTAQNANQVVKTVPKTLRNPATASDSDSKSLHTCIASNADLPAEV